MNKRQVLLAGSAAALMVAGFGPLTTRQYPFSIRCDVDTPHGRFTGFGLIQETVKRVIAIGSDDRHEVICKAEAAIVDLGVNGILLLATESTLDVRPYPPDYMSIPFFLRFKELHYAHMMEITGYQNELLQGVYAGGLPAALPTDIIPQIVWIPDRNDLGSQVHLSPYGLQDYTRGIIRDISATLGDAHGVVATTGPGAWLSQLEDSSDRGPGLSIMMRHVKNTQYIRPVRYL